MGFLTGLGQGLQQLGQASFQGAQLDRAAKERALQRLLQQEQADRDYKLREAAQQRMLDQGDQTQARWLASNVPEGTEYDAPTQDLLTRTGMTPFMTAQQTLPSRDIGGSLPPPDAPITMQAATGEPAGGDIPTLMQRAQAHEQIPDLLAGAQSPGGGTPDLLMGAMKTPTKTGKVVSVPTETSAQQNKLEVERLKAETTRARISQIYAAKQQIASEHDKVVKAIADARDQNAKTALGQRLTALAQGWARLDQEAQRIQNTESWRYDVQLPDMINDNETADYRAKNPGTGRAAGGSGGFLPTPGGPPPPAGAGAGASGVKSTERPPVTHSPGAKPGAQKSVSRAQIEAIAKKNKTTYAAEEARAKTEGFVVR